MAWFRSIAVFHLIQNVLAFDCSISAIEAGLPSNAKAILAERVSENGTFGEGASNLGYPTNATFLPALCSVVVSVTSSNSSAYTFGLFLPDTWNDRFLAVGNGGYSGGINWVAMGTGVEYGFATMSTDTGHNSVGGDASWALNSPEKLIDWGYRAMHGSVIIAKQVTAAYYANPLTFSYYSGCSTGGRQGLKEVQEYPEDFDGVLVGAPSWWTDRQEPWHIRTSLANLPVNSSHYIPDALFNVVSDEVLRQCDSQDGIVDGVIMDYKRCNFWPESLLCGAMETNFSSCLMAPQLDTLIKLYEPIIDVNNTWNYPSFNLGTEKQMAVSMGTANMSALGGVSWTQYFVYNDPTWDWRNFDYQSLQDAERVNAGQATADNFDLAPFHAAGGKLLMYHGTADGQIPVEASEYYYDHVRRNLKQATTSNVTIDDFYRFFLVPGLQHCSGGTYNAPWYVAGPSQQGVFGQGTKSVPGYEDADHDALLALMKWVEDGTPVEKLIATKFKNETLSSGVQGQRPVCLYPGGAVYKGTGEVENPDSWKCVRRT